MYREIPKCLKNYRRRNVQILNHLPKSINIKTYPNCYSLIHTLQSFQITRTTPKTKTFEKIKKQISFHFKYCLFSLNSQTYTLLQLNERKYEIPDSHFFFLGNQTHTNQALKIPKKKKIKLKKMKRKEKKNIPGSGQ